MTVSPATLATAEKIGTLEGQAITSLINLSVALEVAAAEAAAAGHHSTAKRYSNLLRKANCFRSVLVRS